MDLPEHGHGSETTRTWGRRPVTPPCDQDQAAYGPRAARDILSASFRISLLHTACSGEVIDGLWSDQLPWVNASHDVATLTIGGNDIAFAKKVQGCYLGNCGPDVFSLSADTRGGSQTWDQVHDLMATTYIKIRRRMAPGGHLYVLTYPIPFSRSSNGSCQGFTAGEQNAANALVTRLDDTIYQAVQRANNRLPAVHGRPGNVHFVDWRAGTRITNGYTIPAGYTGAGQQFDTYTSASGLCNSSGNIPFINGFVRYAFANPNKSNSFHPNSTGYWHAAQALASSIRTHQP